MDGFHDRLLTAYSSSMQLIAEISGHPPKFVIENTEKDRRFNEIALELDKKFLEETVCKVWKAIYPSSPTPPLPSALRANHEMIGHLACLIIPVGTCTDTILGVRG